jgi:RND family efflux transporter MFP subunit
MRITARPGLRYGLLLGLVLAHGRLLAASIEAELVWARLVELGTPVKGVIQRIEVEAGQRVAKGALLLQLDQRTFVAAVNRQQARLRKLAAVRAEARREWDRARELYDRTVLSDHELQVAENGWIAADADYQAARAALQVARVELEQSSLKAPFAAWVVRREAEVGETVVPNLQPAVLLVLADAARLRARAAISGRQLAGLKIGAPATVVSGGREYAGRIARLTLEPRAAADPSRRYSLEVEFPVGEVRLLAGQAADIRLP